MLRVSHSTDRELSMADVLFEIDDALFEFSRGQALRKGRTVEDAIRDVIVSNAAKFDTARALTPTERSEPAQRYLSRQYQAHPSLTFDDIRDGCE